MCLRYIHKGLLKVETGDMSANAISGKILDVLEPLQLVGFGFNGASVMPAIKGRCR